MRPPLSPLERLSRASRVPAGAWMVLIWFAVTAYTVFSQLQTRGLSVFSLSAGNQEDELVGAVLVVIAGRCASRPLRGLCLLLLGTVLSVMAMAVQDIPLLQFLAVDVAVCYLAATQPRRTSVTAGLLALGTLVGYSGCRALFGLQTDGFTTLTAALATTIVWLIGHAVRQGHEHTEALRTRVTQQAITSERLRIARELHDMVAHNIGIVALQAGAARRVFDTQPDRARAALGEVEASGRETLAGMRRLLGALREADGTPSDEPARSTPMPGLDDVPGLATSTTAAGVRVDVTWSGPRRRLPPEIELSAYRIVQEAVTNVVRHAGAPSCRVTIAFRASDLALEIVDEGRSSVPHTARPAHRHQGPRGPRASGQGYGIVGMRERVALLHGDLSAGPRPGGGFRVAARLPVPAQDRAVVARRFRAAVPTGVGPSLLRAGDATGAGRPGTPTVPGPQASSVTERYDGDTRRTGGTGIAGPADAPAAHAERSR